MGIGIGSLNVGNLVEKVCDTIGLPEAIGDIGSGVANYLTGNYAGLIEDGFDLAENLQEQGFKTGEGMGSWRKPGAEEADPCPVRPEAPSRSAARAPAAPEPAKPSAQTEPSSPLAPAGGPAGETRAKTESMLESLRKGVKPEGMTDEDFARFRLQHEMNEYSAMITLLTNLMKMAHDTNMAIVRNISA